MTTHTPGPTCQMGLWPEPGTCQRLATHAVANYFLKAIPGRKPHDRKYYLCAEHAAEWNGRPFQGNKANPLKKARALMREIEGKP